MSEEPNDPISRRRILKRIGAGAAVAWTAPILTSIRTPAFAASGPCAGCPPYDCVNPQTCSPTCHCGPHHEGGGCICFSFPGTCNHGGGAPICATDADCGNPRARCLDANPDCGCNGNVLCAVICG